MRRNTLFRLIIPSAAVVSSLPSIEFRVEDAKPSQNLVDFSFKSRITLPYGPDLYQRDPPQSSNDQPYAGYGAGMGASESILYDHINHYLYSMSVVGYILVADYEDPHHPKLTEYSFPTLSDDLGSIEICPEQHRFFVGLEEEGRIDIYETVNRSNPKQPKLLQSLDAGANLKNILVNKDCSMIVGSNENEGEDLSQGAITIIQNFLTTAPEEEPTTTSTKVTTIPMDFNQWDDDYLLRRGLNMPLTKNALEYWDDYSHMANDVDFKHTRDNYKAAIFLEPERLAWNGPDETELLVNMQDNNGLLRINMTDFSPVAVAGYGLKDHSRVPIDLNTQDKTCDLRKYDSLFAMRNPDAIQTVRYNDKYYVLTANEGGGKEFGDEWEEEFDTTDVFAGAEFGLKNVYIPPYIFNPENVTQGHSALFNDECTEGINCVPATISVGSNSIDFESDPKNPIFYRMVLLGGRGWSIYELPDDPEDLLKLVFDSADAMERDGCEHYPWSHNSVQDEDYAPMTGPNNTYWLSADEDDRESILEKNDPEQDGCEDQGDGTPGACPLSENVDEESDGVGSAVENIVVGEACGRLVAAVASEQTSVGMVFDITDITSPDLVKVFHLTPVSQYKSMGLAYNDGELGEVDPESSVFLRQDQSPSGKAGILWAGAHSGTVSWWEFECSEYDTEE